MCAYNIKVRQRIRNKLGDFLSITDQKSKLINPILKNNKSYWYIYNKMPVENNFTFNILDNT